MKIKTILMSVVALVAMVLGNVQTAQAQTGSQMAAIMAEMFNSEEMQNQIAVQSQGMITGMNATSSGSNLTVDFKFASVINIADLSAAEKKELSDTFLGSLNGMKDELKTYGMTISIHFKDVYGHSMDFNL